MVEKIKLEFFPELELHISRFSKIELLDRVVVYPSKDSLNLYKLTRIIKRKLLSNKMKDNQQVSKKNSNIVVIKNHTGHKRYFVGTKLRVQLLPTVTIFRKVVYKGKPQTKKEFEDIVNEILS
ncbi:MAG: hypothetical protein KAJ51_05815 [Thermoplasmata archaeon]|nr:hypothetical protein [Thermoplasmata archaeon]